MTVGIISYRVCIPRYRIKVSEIARVWNTDVQSIADGIRMQEKSVQDMDDWYCDDYCGSDTKCGQYSYTKPRIK